jgi:hypothetical protein
MIAAWRAVTACAIAILLGACATAPTPSAPPATNPAPVGPSVATSSPNVAASSDPAAGWQMASLPENVAATFSDVELGPEGFLVAGGGGPIGQTPVILNSLDWQSWSSEPINGSFAAPSGLLTLGARGFAVGGGETSRCAHPSALTTWARDFAGSWHEAPFDHVFCAGPGNVTMFEFDRHVVLAGAGVGDQPFYLTSEDGLRWTDAGPNPFGDIYPHSILAWDKDLWIFGSAPNGAPVVVHRSAGRPFEPPVAIPGLGTNASIIAAVWLDNGPVVVATTGAVAGVLRPDGAGSWAGVPAARLPADQVTGIEVVDGHLVALGSTEAGVPQAWTSADGSEWKPVALPEEAGPGTTLNDVEALGRAVLVGQMEAPNGNGAIGAIWTGPASLLAP